MTNNFYADRRTFTCLSCGIEKPQRRNTINKYCSRKCIPVAMLGRTFTEETRLKMSIAKKGMHISPATEIKIGERLSPNTEYKKLQENKNWRGGTSFQKQSFGNSKYMIWRKAVLERDNYICQGCGIQSEFNETDHIEPWAINESLRFDINNGQTLCTSCHKIKTKTDLSNIYKIKNLEKNIDL